MTRPTLIIAIRCAVLAVGCLWIGPEWGWLPLALMMPVFDTACTVTCGRCASSTGPCTFQVVVSGVTNGSCGTCSGMNGTFLCSTFLLVGTPTDDCEWRGTTSVCGANFPNFRITDSGADRQVFVIGGGTGIAYDWRKTYTSGDGADCVSFSDTIPAFTAGSGNCNLTGSTCVVSAV